MPAHSKLIKMRIENIGCIGPEGLEVELDDILTIVGANNTGKSTVLKAYELAVGNVGFNKDDRCIRALDKNSSVEIVVLIPEKTPNIAEKWKFEEDGLEVVKSKWEWDKDLKRNRKTWDPEINDWAEDGKAAGLDTVFNSRLPKPLRVGTLEEPTSEHDKLLKIILQPIADKLQSMIEKEDSELKRALISITKIAQLPVEDEQKRINTIANDLNKSQNEIFPNISLLFNIGIGEIDLQPVQLLMKNSQIKFKDWSDEVDWRRQGTGSQRALFWSILQVRSRLTAINDIKIQNEKELASLQKQAETLRSKIPALKRDDAIQSNKAKLAETEKKIEVLNRINPEEEIENTSSEISLPGYMLLIDEPEVGLHPSAIRAASHYLYSLAKDSSWQVIVSTHSPLFVDPLQDHTKILRIERDDKNLTPKTYRSDKVEFSSNELENLKMLNRFDQALAEMFFGQKPIVIEGDTEFAAFEYIMNTFVDEFPPSKRPVLIRARGKDTIALIVKMLSNFKTSFSVLHDADFTVKKSAWSANERLESVIVVARSEGCKVVHRISLPTFELNYLPVELDEDGKLKYPSDKNKPWNFYEKLRDSQEIQESVKSLLLELVDENSLEKPIENDFITGLETKVSNWITENCPQDSTLLLKEKKHNGHIKTEPKAKTN